MSSIPEDNLAIAAPAATGAAAAAGAPTGFTYHAQDDAGRRITGTVDAADAPSAVQRLTAMQLRVVQVSPLVPPAGDKPTAGRPISGDDFLAFNQQLAHLAAAGLPVEAGLRLIARDLRRGRLARTIQQVAEQLDKGTPLAQAFKEHGSRFPSLYGHLLDAGVRSGNLGGVLLSFGKHLELVQRLRAQLWRTLSYPLMVIVVLLLVLAFLGMAVLPQMRNMFSEFKLKLPFATEMLFAVADLAPYLGAILIVALIGGPFIWGLLRLRGMDRRFVDSVILRLPLIGTALSMNLIARWCDSLRIGVASGLPLPEAIGLANDSVRSPRLRKDGQTLIDRLEAGRAIDDAAAPRLSLLPATVPAAMALASGHRDLPATLASLTELYERQAELRVNRVPAILTPTLVILIATIIGFVIIGLMMPLLTLIEGLTSSHPMGHG